MHIYVLTNVLYVYECVCILYAQECGGGATRAPTQTPACVAAATVPRFVHM